MFVTQGAARVRSEILSLVALCCMTGATRAQSEATPKPVTDKEAELKTLLKERRNTLQTVVERLVAENQFGRVEFLNLAQAQREALRATLEVDDSLEVRLTTLRKYHENAKAILQFAEARFKVGQSSQVAVLQAQAFVLEAKIELLREELKVKAGK